MRTRPAALMPEENVARAPAPPPKPGATRKKAGEPAKAEPLRFYRVEDGPRKAGDPNKVGPFRLSTPAGGDYFLTLGSEISSADYDIKKLKSHGCKLVEIETPGWFIEQQEIAAEKAAQLREAGIEVGPEAPEFVPTPLEGKKPARSEAEGS